MYSFTLSYYLNNENFDKELVIKIFKKQYSSNAPNEYAILKALSNRNLPAPAAYLYEPNDSSGERPFIIMEKISGQHTSDLIYNEETARNVIKKMADTLFQLHTVDPNIIPEYQTIKLDFQNKEEEQLKYLHFIKESGNKNLKLSQWNQKRFTAALKKIQETTPQKTSPAIIHRELEPNHVISSNEKFIIVDWGDALIGDPACDIATAYHLIRLTTRLRDLKINDLDLGNYFVDCYEQKLGHSIPNLHYYKDLAAIDLGLLYGLSPLTKNNLAIIAKFSPSFATTLRFALGTLTGAIWRHKYQAIVKNHHSNYNKSLGYYQEYLLQYLERDRYN